MCFFVKYLVFTISISLLLHDVVRMPLQSQTRRSLSVFRNVALTICYRTFTEQNRLRQEVFILSEIGLNGGVTRQRGKQKGWPCYPSRIFHVSVLFCGSPDRAWGPRCPCRDAGSHPPSHPDSVHSFDSPHHRSATYPLARHSLKFQCSLSTMLLDIRCTSALLLTAHFKSLFVDLRLCNKSYRDCCSTFHFSSAPLPLLNVLSFLLRIIPTQENTMDFHRFYPSLAPSSLPGATGG